MVTAVTVASPSALVTSPAVWADGLPGMYPGVPEGIYHQSPGFTQSIAKEVLDCPAKARWAMDHYSAPSDAMEQGTVLHELILGQPTSFTVIDADSYRTDAAKKIRDAARAEGMVPLLAAKHAELAAVAEQVRAHPLAAMMLAGEGDNELSVRWERDGVLCRGRLDRLTVDANGQLVVVDLKSAKSADPSMRAWPSDAARLGYDIQVAAYLEAVKALTGQDAAWVWLVVEVGPPVIVTALYATPEVVASGQRKWGAALELYRACDEAGEWPGYSNEIQPIEWPAWAA